MNQIAKDCAAETERRIDAQEELDASVRATVTHWKNVSARDNNDPDLDKFVDNMVLDHIADPYSFVHLALMAQLSGKGAEFLEAQLKALALCEVDHG